MAQNELVPVFLFCCRPCFMVLNPVYIEAHVHHVNVSPANARDCDTCGTLTNEWFQCWRLQPLLTIEMKLAFT